jgi:hypothetical protein
VHGFMKMSPTNKQNSEGALDTACVPDPAAFEVNPRASTSYSSTKMISEAFDVAMQAFQTRKSENWNTALMVLTDGRDTHQSAASHQKMLVRLRSYLTLMIWLKFWICLLVVCRVSVKI